MRAAIKSLYALSAEGRGPLLAYKSRRRRRATAAAAAAAGVGGGGGGGGGGGEDRVAGVAEGYLLPPTALRQGPILLQVCGGCGVWGYIGCMGCIGLYRVI